MFKIYYMTTATINGVKVYLERRNNYVDACGTADLMPHRLEEDESGHWIFVGNTPDILKDIETELSFFINGSDINSPSASRL